MSTIDCRALPKVGDVITVDGARLAVTSHQLDSRNHADRGASLTYLVTASEAAAEVDPS